MSDIKLPVFLLACILCGLGFYFYNKSQKPVQRKIKPNTAIALETSDEAKKLEETENETSLIKEAVKLFKSGDYKGTIEKLVPYQTSSSYEIQQMLAYSFSEGKEFDRAIVFFEKALEIRKIPLDGYSLAYLYEITGRYAAAAGLYQELSDLDLPANLRRRVYEGAARLSVLYPENKELYAVTKKLVQSWSDSRDGIMSLLKLMTSNREYSGIDGLEKAIDKNLPKDYAANYELARLLNDMGKYEEAVKYYKKCIKIEPENLTPFLDCYNSLMKADKPEAAVRALEYFLASGQPFPNLYFDAALVAHKVKKTRAAFRFYLAAVTSDPKLQGKNDEGLMAGVERLYLDKGAEVEKVFVNAFICYLNGDYNYALSEIERVKPELENSVYKDDYKLVVKQCHRLAKIDKKRDDEIKAYEDFVKAQEAEKKLKEEAQAKKAAESKAGISKGSDDEIKTRAYKAHRDFDVQFETAKEFINRGNLGEAKFFLKSCIRLNPRAIAPYLEMAQIQMIEKDKAGLDKSLETAIALEPTNVKALTMAASVNLNSNNISKAKEYAEAALKVSPNDSFVMIVAANVYMREEKYNEASALVESALAKEKNSILRAELKNLQKEIVNKR